MSLGICRNIPIIKNTWAKDESSDDDFQKDLEREDSPRYLEYKKSKEQVGYEKMISIFNSIKIEILCF